MIMVGSAWNVHHFVAGVAVRSSLCSMLYFAAAARQPDDGMVSFNIVLFLRYFPPNSPAPSVALSPQSSTKSKSKSIAPQ